MNISELAHEAHEINKQNGFWQTERNFDECIMLIVSELGEALEAHRKGRNANFEVFKEEYNKMLEEYHPNHAFINRFEAHIKDTVQDELADVAIRLMDLIVGFGYEFHETSACVKLWSDNMGANLLRITKWILSIDYVYDEDTLKEIVWPSQCVKILFDFAEHLNIDLEWHIRAKLKYNKTRGFKHGKQY